MFHCKVIPPDILAFLKKNFFYLIDVDVVENWQNIDLKYELNPLLINNYFVIHFSTYTQVYTIKEIL